MLLSLLTVFYCSSHIPERCIYIRESFLACGIKQSLFFFFLFLGVITPLHSLRSATSVQLEVGGCCFTAPKKLKECGTVLEWISTSVLSLGLKCLENKASTTALGRVFCRITDLTVRSLVTYYIFFPITLH